MNRIAAFWPSISELRNGYRCDWPLSLEIVGQGECRYAGEIPRDYRPRLSLERGPGKPQRGRDNSGQALEDYKRPCSKYGRARSRIEWRARERRGFRCGGVQDTLKLRAELEGGDPNTDPGKYLDLSYYQRALAAM